MAVTGYDDGWQGRLYDQLREANVSIFGYVPDAGHRVLIDRSIADNDVHSVPLTTEEFSALGTSLTIQNEQPSVHP